MRLVIDSLGEQLVSRELYGIAARGADVRPAMEDIADLIRRDQVRQFDSEGAYGSGGWAPLAPSTVEHKRREGLDPHVLHAKRRLRDSTTEKGHPEHVSIATKDGLTIGTLVPYAVHHQRGTDRMPQRRVMQFPEATRREIPRALQRHLVGTDPARRRGAL